MAEGCCEEVLWEAGRVRGPMKVCCDDEGCAAGVSEVEDALVEEAASGSGAAGDTAAER